MKITSVEPQKKNPKRFNIFLDGVFTFGADEDLVVDHRLVIGKTFTTSDVEQLLFESEVGKLMERMYRLFNIRQRSEQEVRRYLKNLSFKRKIKGDEEISDAAIELLINKLKQKRLLSDEEFAKSWIESRRKTKQKGIRAIKAELFQKGINKDLIEETLGGVSKESEKDLAAKALEKKMRLWEKLSAGEFRKKAYEYLMRRGFEYEIVREVVENLMKKKYNVDRESEVE